MVVHPCWIFLDDKPGYFDRYGLEYRLFWFCLCLLLCLARFLLIVVVVVVVFLSIELPTF